MNFTFLHCADLHLGSPLLGLSARDSGVAERFAAASRDAFSDLVRRAIEEKVAFVLIAGDVYDGEWRDSSIGLFFNREISRLARAQIPVFLIKGNHDAASVVTSAVALPESVTVFSTRKPETHFHPLRELRVAIHGRSFPDRVVDKNWALEYPPPEPGWFNIGMLHSSCDGRPPHATYAPCSLADLVGRGYDYWALGHVHEFEILSRDPWVVFPGNLQGRSVRECGAKGAVIVEVTDGRVIDVRRVIVDRARFADVRVDVTDAQSDEDVWNAIKIQIAPVLETTSNHLIAARVRLAGTTSLHRDLLARRGLVTTNTRASLQHLHHDLWLEKLLIETHEPSVPTHHDELAQLDLDAMFDVCMGNDDLRNDAKQLLMAIGQKLPETIREEFSAEDINVLIEEARALVLGRAKGKSA